MKISCDEEITRNCEGKLILTASHDRSLLTGELQGTATQLINGYGNVNEIEILTDDISLEVNQLGNRHKLKLHTYFY